MSEWFRVFDETVALNRCFREGLEISGNFRAATLRVIESLSDEWVDVSERLPASGEEVLIVGPSGVELGWHERGTWFVRYSPRPIPVSHWRHQAEMPTDARDE